MAKAFANLSPLTAYDILARNLRARDDADKHPRKPEMVVMYRCAVCTELHEWEEDAEACCAPARVEPVTETDCPVCGTGYDTAREAADCCLWGDVDQPARWRIAEAVEAGSTWAQALCLES